MAKVVIAGKDYFTQPLKFKALKRAWPLIQEVQNAKEDSPVAAMEALVGIVSLALQATQPELTPDVVEDMMDAKDIKGFREALRDIMVESGLIEVASDTPGEAFVEGATVPPSTGTSTESLQNSLPLGANPGHGTE